MAWQAAPPRAPVASRTRTLARSDAMQCQDIYRRAPARPASRGRSVVRPRPRPRPGGFNFYSTWGTVNRVVSPIHMGFVNLPRRVFYLGLLRWYYQHQHQHWQRVGLRSCPLLLLSPPSVRPSVRRTPHRHRHRRPATGGGRPASRPLKWQRARRWCGHVSCGASHVRACMLPCPALPCPAHVGSSIPEKVVNAIMLATNHPRPCCFFVCLASSSASAPHARRDELFFFQLSGLCKFHWRCLVPEIQKVFKIPRHIESCGTCMKH